MGKAIVCKTNWFKWDMVVHVYNSSTLEAEKEGLQIWGQPGLYSKFLSQKEERKDIRQKERRKEGRGEGERCWLNSHSALLWLINAICDSTMECCSFISKLLCTFALWDETSLQASYTFQMRHILNLIKIFLPANTMCHLTEFQIQVFTKINLRNSINFESY
jgi:hypothetical protein